jgi:hypothetical protein
MLYSVKIPSELAVYRHCRLNKYNIINKKFEICSSYSRIINKKPYA